MWVRLRRCPCVWAPSRQWPPLLLCFTVFSVSVDGASQGPCTQGDLFSNVTADYDHRQRPHSEGEPVDVEIQLYLTSLTEINQKEQQLGVAGYYRVWWTDSRLAFKSKSEGGCFDLIHLTNEEGKKIWQPDLYFDNVLNEEFHGADSLKLNSSGSLKKSNRINHHFECKMNFVRIPFDTQICSIIVGSYSEDATQVRVRPRGGDSGLTYAENSFMATVWNIDRVDSYVVHQVHDGQDWTYVFLDLTLSRLPDYYVRGIVLKAVLFVIISWCSFFVNRNVAPARVAISVIPVLIMINLLNAVDALLPPVPYSTFLTNFLITCLFFASCTVFEYAVVAYLLQNENWYAEKGAVLLHLSKTGLVKTNEAHHPLVVSDGETAPPDSENDGFHGIRSLAGLRARKLSDGSLGEHAITPPAKLFRDHPVITEIYKEFDHHHNGCFSAKMMRNTLRHYGQYRSLREVREIFEKLGVVEGEDMTLEHFEQFLADPTTYIPVTPTKRSFWDMPPSLQLDIVMRILYPAVFALMSFIIGMSLL